MPNREIVPIEPPFPVLGSSAQIIRPWIFASARFRI